MIKHWESSILVLLLLISVFGCAKRSLNALPFQGAYANCSQSNLGQFQVIINPSQTNPGYYEIVVTAYLVPTAGQIVRIALANNSYYRDLTQGVPLTQNSTVFRGPISASDLSLYQVVGIVPTSGGQSTFFDETNPNNEICQLPPDTISQTPVY